MSPAPPADAPEPRATDNAARLERYLLKDEKIVVATNRHWLTVAEPPATALLTLIAVVWFSSGPLVTQRGLGPVADFCWWVWFAVLARALFVLWEWRHDWFIATDRRLLLVYGFIIRKVNMMPLGKVTDMTYHRTVMGRLLGYGTFVLESAGQDQALSRIEFIPRPDATYRAMIAEIFHRDGDEPEPAQNEAYVEQVEAEDDPTRRLALSHRIARFAVPDQGREPWGARGAWGDRDDDEREDDRDAWRDPWDDEDDDRGGDAWEDDDAGEAGGEATASAGVADDEPEPNDEPDPDDEPAGDDVDDGPAYEIGYDERPQERPPFRIGRWEE